MLVEWKREREREREKEQKTVPELLVLLLQHGKPFLLLCEPLFDSFSFGKIEHANTTDGRKSFHSIGSKKKRRPV